jgi:hypothetical protein
MTLAACILPLCLASAVSFDAARHAVSIEAVSAGCAEDATVEFLLVGPSSDNGYEAAFFTDATPAEIADAFDKAGIPRGLHVDFRNAAFWPAGVQLTMTPAFTNLVRDVRKEGLPQIVYTGGSRLADGTPIASTNEPCAVFALYGCEQSLIQFDDNLDQSATYGRFHLVQAIPEGDRRTITFAWNGDETWRPYTMKFVPGGLAKAVADIREAAAGRELSVTTDFSSELTLAEARACAQAVEMLDSRTVKINGCAKGQFYYRAFLPNEDWRERKKRLSQPPEVHFAADGKIRVCEIKEEWSDDEADLEPKLSEIATEYADAKAAAEAVSKLAERTSVVLMFAPLTTKLERFYELRNAAAKGIVQWYVFSE